jgi:hypothetical protein
MKRRARTSTAAASVAENTTYTGRRKLAKVFQNQSTALPDSEERT